MERIDQVSVIVSDFGLSQDPRIDNAINGEMSKQIWHPTDMVAVRMADNQRIDPVDPLVLQKWSNESLTRVRMRCQWSGIDKHILFIGKLDKRRIALADIQKCDSHSWSGRRPTNDAQSKNRSQKHSGDALPPLSLTLQFKDQKDCCIQPKNHPNTKMNIGISVSQITAPCCKADHRLAKSIRQRRKHRSEPHV